MTITEQMQDDPIGLNLEDDYAQEERDLEEERKREYESNQNG